MTTVQNYVFSMYSPATGRELWITDGTVGGARLVRDIFPGVGWSGPDAFALLGDGRVVFRANTLETGTELWVTDGTEAGTMLVKDVAPGSATGHGGPVLSLPDGRVLFSGAGVSGGFTVWVTDGTEAGTVVLKEINPTGSASVGSFTLLSDGRVLLAANDGTHGTELWVTNGTEAGTMLVKDVSAGSSGISQILATNDGRAFVSMTDGTHGTELWVTDGTEAGTMLVKDINAGAASSNLGVLTLLSDGRVMFSAVTGAEGRELWVSDGTEAGTHMVKDLVAGTESGNPSALAELNDGRVLFSATDGVSGAELWVTDGTEAGTQILADIFPGSGGSNPNLLTKLDDGRVLFVANDGGSGLELWVTDGTAVGTQLVKDMAPGVLSSSPYMITPISGGRAFLSANNGVDGNVGWITDGTEAGTYEITSGGLSPYYFTTMQLNAAPGGVPTVMGTFAQGQVLTADGSAITDTDGLGTLSYRWQRGDGAGGFVDITNANGTSYTLTQDDVGRPVQVVVSYIDGLGKLEQVASLASGPVANVNDVPVGVPVVLGLASQGEMLSASVAGVTDADGMGTVSYVWQRDDGAGGFSDIPDATGATYTLAQADVGRAVRVVANYTDQQGTPEQVISLATPTVENTNDMPVGPLVLNGLAQQGEVLTADGSAISDADGLGEFTYVWQRDVGLGFADIEGAASASYTLTQEDVGHAVRAVVRYVDGHGAPEEVSSVASLPVVNVNDAPVGTPTVSGTTERGSTLTASALIDDPDGMGPLHYRWEREIGTGSFTTIDGATSESYELAREDIGHGVRVVVGYTDGQGSAEEVVSGVTATVTARSITGAPEESGVSYTQGMTSADVAQRVADGDVIRPDAGTQLVRLADGDVSFDAASDAAFLSRLYHGLLGRAGEQPGMSYWAHQSEGAMDRLGVAGEFLASGEFQGRAGEMDDTQFVQRLYQDLLGRAPDAEGLAYFTERLTGGDSRAQILVEMAASDEAGGNWNDAFGNGVFIAGQHAGVVRAAYSAAFGREAEAAGLRFYGDSLTQGLSLKQWGDVIETSTEFQTLHGQQSDHDFVESLFTNGLGRSGAAEDVAYYENLLAQGTHDRGDLVMAFATSQEAQGHLSWAL